MFAFAGLVCVRRVAFGHNAFTGVRPNVPQAICAPCVRMATASNSGKPPRPPRRMPAVTRPVVPTKQLLDFTLGLEDKAQTRSSIVKILSQYVKENNLQNPENRRIIECDHKLKTLFGVEQCTMLEIGKYLRPYLQKPEDVGGRYLEEAKQIEFDYFVQKDEKKAREARLSADGTPRRSRAKARKPRVFKKQVLSDELAAVLKVKLLTRHEALKAIWEYINTNGLKDETSGTVVCDSSLRTVFGKDKLTVQDVMTGLGPHLTVQQDNS